MDMDAFFASVEQLDEPKLRGKCVIVGGLTDRGVVSTASYEARKFGIHSAMPVYKAKRLCPQGIFLPPRMKRYKEISNKIMTILGDLSPLVEPVSIDEAYVDLAGCERIQGDPLVIAMKLKSLVRKKVHLNCSVGVAPNKFLAKIASDMDKPDGLKIIMPDEAQRFIKDIPIAKVPGVGKKTKRILDHLGIITLGDTGHFSEELLIKKLGKFGKRLAALSACIDFTPVVPESHRKSVSCEETLLQDTEDRHLLKNYILKFSDDIGKELRRLNQSARTIILKIKHSDYQLISRRVTIQKPTQSAEVIYSEAAKLLEKYNDKKKIRLIGVGATGFVSKQMYTQLEIFGQTDYRNKNWEQVDRAIDRISKKYGDHMVRRASLSKQT